MIKLKHRKCGPDKATFLAICVSIALFSGVWG